MPDIKTKQKYIIKYDLAMEVANLVGIDTYDPSRTDLLPSNFLRHELVQIYEAVTGESGEELSQREMNNVMIQELGSELHVAYLFNLTKEDLKLIHEALVSDSKEE